MKTLWKWVLGACLLVAGAQSAWAMSCDGTIYIKLPKSWNSAVINMDGKSLKFPTTTENGWYVFNAGTLGETYSKEFIIMEKADGWNDGGITTKHYGAAGGQGGWDQADKFSCDDINKNGKEALYIYEDPTTEGKTAYTNDPPNAKYFFMMIPPDFTEWMSSTPMISMDGGLTGKPMKADPEKCGWYYYVWFGEEITDDVVFFRDDDTEKEDVIGLNGNWETGATATPIQLKMIFDMDVDTLYFVPDQDQLLADGDDGFYYTFPDGVEGVCSYNLAAIIYDTDASLHGAFTCNPDWRNGQSDLEAKSNACPYPSAPFQVAGSDGRIPCIGVTQGMVETTLNNVKGTANYKKPVLTTKGKSCFGSQADVAFSAMFNSTPNVNETYCVNMPFKKSSDGKWEFDSDTYQSPGATVPGGFYPAESTPADTSLMSARLPAAESKRKAEGPVFMCQGLRNLDPHEGVPYSDLLCKGPGWTKGENCEGLFAGGSEFDTEFNGVSFLGDGWGWGCPNEAPMGWVFYEKGTEDSIGSVKAKGQIPTGTNQDSRWASGSSDKAVLSVGGRNQHFCFESHAKFTYRPGLRFSFRGDDDIWVYIDNKLAVDLGGTHLAAPGYVDLDAFEGASGALKKGDEYDLDIYFCDRRTTMSNVRIKTNMYIRQKTKITAKPDENKTSDGGTPYHICYRQSGGGSCAAAMSNSDEEVVYCDEQITQAGLNISYTLVNGNNASAPAMPQLDGVTVPGKYYCGIDLTNFGVPVVNKDNMCQLGPGRYKLYVSIDGGTPQQVGGVIRIAGELDVVNDDAVVLDEEGNEISGKKYKVTKSAMGGELVPVYISAVGEDNGKVSISPDVSVGQSYTLEYDKKMLVFKDPEGKDQVHSGEALVIGDDGVDTVYVTVPMEDLENSSNLYTIGVKGRTRVQTINFYLPRIVFVESIPVGDEDATAVTGQKPEADGSYEEFWVGSMYELYLAILKPDDSGNGFYPCLEECNGISIHRDVRTSENITFTDAVFENGYATISVSASKDYRYDLDPTIHNPGVIVAAFNDYVYASYNPIYFREPPVPSPRLADVFDVHGSAPSVELKIPGPYFDMNQEYLDGIADSVVIYYHRAIHQDSLPSKVCIVWDSTTAEKHNPVDEGFSNIKKDTLIVCNVLVSVTSANIDCSNPVDGYCSNAVTLGGFKLSEGIKTSGKGRVISYAEFKDKGKDVKQGFPGDLTDRIAPVPLRAELRTIKDTDLDSLVVVLSEPVIQLGSDEQMKSALDFYLNSAVEIDESSRFMSALNATPYVVVSSQKPGAGVGSNGEGRVRFVYNRANTALFPQPGDYVRLAGNLSNVFWSDDSVGRNPLGSDTLRAVADAAYYWNSPTAYNETKRLPTPWVSVVGETRAELIVNSFAHTGNAVVTDTTSSLNVTLFRAGSKKSEILTALNGRPFHWAKNGGINSAISNLEKDADRAQVKLDMDSDPKSVYFAYELQYFTNLGNYVGGETGKIYCDDRVNHEKYNVYYFNGGRCDDANNTVDDVVISWNMISNKGRAVGTGAYITKFKSYVKLGSVGKKSTVEGTKVFGVKRSAKPYEEYKKNGAAE